MRTVPVASRLAERYLREAIEIGKAIDAYIRQAQAYLDLGLLYLHKRRFSDARDHIEESILLFNHCGADVLLAEAQAALEAIPR